MEESVLESPEPRDDEKLRLENDEPWWSYQPSGRPPALDAIAGVSSDSNASVHFASRPMAIANGRNRSKTARRSGGAVAAPVGVADPPM